jgi:hypothetical protein
MIKFTPTPVLTLMSIMIFCNLSVGQNGWNKDERNNLYSDCMAYSGRFKNITPEQRESVCLCYLDEITKKYDKNDYQARIEIEMKRIREASLSQCSKNIGVDLSVREATTESGFSKDKPVKEALLGTWRTDKGETIEFREDGRFSQINPKGIMSAGEWFLDEEGTLTLVTEKRRTQMITNKELIDRVPQTYDVNSFSRSFLKFTNRTRGETIQANRIK